MILVPDLKTIESTSQSAAETRLARLLRQVPGPADAVAFHSVKLRSHRYKQQAEADFVILWKGVVLVIEVKGGGVTKDGGSWYSRDRAGEWHPLPTGPMEQARSAMYALADILQEENAGWFAREAIVVTPDIESPPHSVEWKASHWLAKADMTVERLRRLLDDLAENAPEPPPRQRAASTSTLRSWLFGEFSRLPVIDAMRGTVLEEQERATREQARVVAGAAMNERMMVLGGAGTGKSLALAQLARQEAANGADVLVTFGSPALGGYFDTLLSGHAVVVAPFAGLDAGRDFDVVLIDEAQDLMNAGSMDRLETLVRGGRSAGRWRMFLDPNNQAHVDGRFDPDVYAIVMSECAVFQLDRNVRNTKGVVDVVKNYLGADIGDPGIVHGDQVQWYTVPEARRRDAVADIARSLASEGVARSEVWVIPAGDACVVAGAADTLAVKTPQEAKGLEADHVIVCSLPKERTTAAMAALYVAITRPRVGLHMVVTPEERKFMQSLAKHRLVGE
ncbi:NERD domain-containing protein [Demequina pelophila]|uniref:NERD domain-containing protein n=1 Tax=Demequina pelophila TaxID=1638984 RepID=UPI0007808855|nr:NERD domain-containing protein [Demequina pelophila]